MDTAFVVVPLLLASLSSLLEIFLVTGWGSFCKVLLGVVILAVLPDKRYRLWRRITVGESSGDASSDVSLSPWKEGSNSRLLSLTSSLSRTFSASKLIPGYSSRPIPGP